MRRMIQVLWPSFIVAGMMDVVLFTLFDPMGVSYQGAFLFESRLGAYSIGFFLFWLFGATSSALTCYLQCNSAQINKLCTNQDSHK
ncbi:MAG: hypothetical protein ACYCZH_00175 [Sulfuriferula sp.]